MEEERLLGELKEEKIDGSFEENPKRLMSCSVCGRRAFVIKETRLVFNPKKEAYSMSQFIVCKGCNSTFWQAWETLIPPEDFPGDCDCGGRMLIEKIDSSKVGVIETYTCDSCGKKALVEWIATGHKKAKGPKTSILCEYHKRKDYIREENGLALLRKSEFMNDFY